MHKVFKYYILILALRPVSIITFNVPCKYKITTSKLSVGLCYIYLDVVFKILNIIRCKRSTKWLKIRSETTLLVKGKVELFFYGDNGLRFLIGMSTSWPPNRDTCPPPTTLWHNLRCDSLIRLLHLKLEYWNAILLSEWFVGVVSAMQLGC